MTRPDSDEQMIVVGPDGLERHYVNAAHYVQLPVAGTRTFLGNAIPGGAIDNRSDRPLLVLGKGPPHAANPHGKGFLRILPAHTKTDPTTADYDGIVTDARFQPLVTANGTTWMPACIPAQSKATWHKIPDAATGVVAANGAITVKRWFWLGRHGPELMPSYTGQRDITPESPSTRAAAQANIPCQQRSVP